MLSNSKQKGDRLCKPHPLSTLSTPQWAKEPLQKMIIINKDVTDLNSNGAIRPFIMRTHRHPDDDLAIENPTVTLPLRPTAEGKQKLTALSRQRVLCQESFKHEDSISILLGNLQERVADAEIIFRKLDAVNNKQLNLEMFLELLNRLDAKTSIFEGKGGKCEKSDDLLRAFWLTFQKTKRGWLRFDEFRRIISGVKAAESTKYQRPAKGDSNYFVRSNKLNSETTLLESSLRQKLEYRLNDVISEMTRLDDKNKGTISETAFKSVLAELQPQFSNAELRQLSDRYRAANGLISYYEFLKPIAVPHLVKWEMRLALSNKAKQFTQPCTHRSSKPPPHPLDYLSNVF